MGLLEKPIRDVSIDRGVQVAQRGDRRGGGVGRTDPGRSEAIVGPGAILCFQKLERLYHTKRLGEVDLQILMGAQRQKSAVGRA